MAFYTPLIYFFNDILRYLPLRIMRPLATVRYLVTNNISVSRFGDGELNIIMGGCVHFQEYNATLRERLIEILQLPEIPGFKVAIPIMINTLENLTDESHRFWTMNMHTGRMHWHRLCANKNYLDSQFTWSYLLSNNKAEARECLMLLPKLWDNQDVLLIEGEGKFGVNLSFMSNTRSICRIICPSSNAFTHYDEILMAIRRYYRGQLVLLSLGPTASVLAYDLFREKIRAIDIGHLNLCYQEIEEIGSSGKMTEEMYEQQIIARISP